MCDRGARKVSRFGVAESVIKLLPEKQHDLTALETSG